MAAGWIIPALKAVLPHVGDIVTAAKPVFTRKRPESASGENGVLLQQVSELQNAASQNAEHIRELAAQLQSTVAALEKAASIAESRMRRVILFCAVAVGLSVFALGAAVLALLR